MTFLKPFNNMKKRSNKTNTPTENWETYRKQEIARITPALKKIGVTLHEKQVHAGGERYLMSGKKLVLDATHQDTGRVIVKVSSSKKGKQEIQNDRACRQILNSINFAYQDFFLPQEIFFGEQNGCLLSVTAYIEQDQHLIDRPLEEQFFISLRALEAQESVHATTYSHTKAIYKTFGLKGAEDYLREFTEFETLAIAQDPNNERLRQAYARTRTFLNEGKDTIARYAGFLTHHDFVPHNIRIKERDIYLLDHTSIYFGNKYEGWARFVNFMVHHSPELEKALCEYVRANRGEDEYLSLRLMRAYKLGLLIQYYTGTLSKTTGDMHTLMRLRLAFWIEVLEAVLDDRQMDLVRVTRFLDEENALRSDEEKARRKEIISLRK